MNAFLSDEEVRRLTGRTFKALQCANLRQIDVPFFVNAAGRPVVARSAVEGRNVGPASKVWRSAAVG